MENADAAERAIGQKHHVPNGKEYIKVDKNRSTKPPPPHVKKRQQMQLQQQQKQQLQATREHDENVMDPTISRFVKWEGAVNGYVTQTHLHAHAHAHAHKHTHARTHACTRTRTHSHMHTNLPPLSIGRFLGGLAFFK